MPGIAQQTIRELFNSNVNDSNLVYEFNLFDRSVTQKLWSADYYHNAISSHINEFQVFPSASATQSAGLATLQQSSPDIPGYCRHLNRLLDGFFMNTRSVLDTLAHQLYTLYVPQNVPPRIYITTARNMLLNDHATCKTGKLLDKQLSQRWFAVFEPFRNCTTHESLIPYDDIKFSYNQIDQRYYLLKKIKLPDNPQVRPFTYIRNRVASEYCQSVFRKTEGLVEKVYECVLHDIRRNSNILPIP